jgi:hypothetical protein
MRAHLHLFVSRHKAEFLRVRCRGAEIQMECGEIALLMAAVASARLWPIISRYANSSFARINRPSAGI